MGSKRKRQPTLDSVSFHIFKHTFSTKHHADEALLQPERNLVRPTTCLIDVHIRFQFQQTTTNSRLYKAIHYTTTSSTTRPTTTQPPPSGTTTIYFHPAQHMNQHHSQCW
eukprot:25656-Amphidinium_carterae.1